MPISVAVNAINGRMFLMHMSMVSRPAAKNLLTTPPTAVPMRVMMLGFFFACIAAISAFACALDLGAPCAAAAGCSGAAPTSPSSAKDRQLSETSETYKSSVMNFASGPDCPTGIKFTV